jgi:CRP-like cAMP-binding protein
MAPVLLSQFSESLRSGVGEEIHRHPRLFNDAELEILKRAGTLKSYETNDRVFNVDGEAHEIYFVLSGSVLCWEPRADNKFLALDITEPGGVFGEVGTIGKIRRTASATALMPTEILLLPDTKLDDFVRDHPELYQKITQGMVERLQRSADDLRSARLRDPEYSDPPPIGLWDRVRRVASQSGRRAIASSPPFLPRQRLSSARSPFRRPCMRKVGRA